MRTPHIQAVDLVKHGLVVTYDDQTRAFYDESVLLAHLQPGTEAPAARKGPRSASPPPPKPAKRIA